MGYLIDDDFIERLVAEDSQHLVSGSSQNGSQGDEEEEEDQDNPHQSQDYEISSDLDFDPSQDLFVTPKKRKRKLKPVAVRALFKKARNCKARTKEVIEKAKELVEDFAVKPFQNYQIYKDFSNVPGNYSWLISTLSRHIQCQATELHELVRLFETMLFVNFGKLTPFERKQCHMQRAKYFGKGTLR